MFPNPNPNPNSAAQLGVYHRPQLTEAQLNCISKALGAMLQAEPDNTLATSAKLTIDKMLLRIASRALNGQPTGGVSGPISAAAVLTTDQINEAFAEIGLGKLAKTKTEDK